MLVKKGSSTCPEHAEGTQLIPFFTFSYISYTL